MLQFFSSQFCSYSHQLSHLPKLPFFTFSPRLPTTQQRLSQTIALAYASHTHRLHRTPPPQRPLQNHHVASRMHVCLTLIRLPRPIGASPEPRRNRVKIVAWPGFCPLRALSHQYSRLAQTKLFEVVRKFIEPWRTMQNSAIRILDPALLNGSPGLGSAVNPMPGVSGLLIERQRDG